MSAIFRKALIAIIILVGGYYLVRNIAAAEIDASFIQCSRAHAPDLRNLPKREAAARALASSIVECMERRNGSLGRLFFDKDEVMRNFKYVE